MSPAPDNVARALRALSEPDPYRANPFRVLGLSPLANARETSRRVEAVRVAAELGEAPSGWAFAPAAPPGPEAVRAAAESLRDPLARFIGEFFWFWPLAYPADTSDPAMQALASGDTDTATRLWSEAPPEAATAALHNLAVYQHVLALEWEDDPAADPAQLAELRASAADLWRRTLGAPGLATLLAGRLHRLGDPGLPGALASALSALVPEALARTHIRLALRKVEADRLAEADAHIRLAGHFLPAPDAVAKLLAEATAPLAERIQAGIGKLVASPGPPLDLATALVRSVGPDLARLQSLLGRSAPAARAAARALDLAVLDAADAHREGGGAEHLVLPHLLHLLDQPASPELAQRLVSTFERFSALALAASRPADLAPETDLSALDRDLTLQLVLERLFPAGAQILALPQAELRSYHARLASWVVALSTAALATGRPEGEAWARRQLTRALELNPAGSPAAERLSAALARLALADTLALSISGPANTFSLDRSGVALDGHLVAPAELTALRLGVERSSGGEERVLFAWSSAREAHAIYLDQLQEPEAPDPDLPRRVREAVDYFLLPPLVAQAEAALLAGKRVVIGPLTFTHGGVQVETHRLLGSKIQLIPFAQAGVHTTTDGSFLVAAPAHPHLHPPVDPAAVWNALLIPHLIDHFAPPTHSRSA